MRLAICSCDLEHKNFVEVIQFNKQSQQLLKLDSFNLQFPVTKAMFYPNYQTSNQDLLICANDMLRIFSINQDQRKQKLTQKSFLRHEKRRQAPVTAFDWSTIQPHLVIQSSYDTAISLWDINREELEFTFQAHEKSINDVSFSPADPSIFASCASDGTVRVFDRRKIEISQQITQLDNQALRVQFNKFDPHQLAIISNNNNQIHIYDLRNVQHVLNLEKHEKEVNGIAWNPTCANQLLSVGEDGNALIWEGGKAIMGYNCGEPADNCGWSELNKEWCSLIHGDILEILHV
ncbi:WD40 repeat protein [Spironucleus salmonicida]|nr:WD40 repeat protein [Spironucleus salmonicida]